MKHVKMIFDLGQEIESLKQQLTEKESQRQELMRAFERQGNSAQEVITELRQQLSESQAELNEFRKNAKVGFDRQLRDQQKLETSQKREVLLRDEVTRCRDWFETRAKVTSKGGPSSWELMLLWDECDAAEEALASTADLDGLILCHAEPVGIIEFGGFWPNEVKVQDGTPLYAPKGMK